MTDEEIMKMARRFALETSNGDAYDPLAEKYANEVLQWLSELYCIVDRCVMKERYKESELQSISNSRIDMVSGTSRMILLESIFGKDMFEEEKI